MPDSRLCGTGATKPQLGHMSLTISSTDEGLTAETLTLFVEYPDLALGCKETDPMLIDIAMWLTKYSNAYCYMYEAHVVSC